MRSIQTVAVLLLTLFSARAMAEPIRLHPDNPHYFLYQNRPTVLVTSGEHYGAVLNLDFDYVKYLDALKAHGFNYTRTFSGVYREIPGSFAIRRNTLAPAPLRYLAPWARSTQDGYNQGGARFDLTRWDDAYFTRLKDFVTQAGRRGIVVEFTLFCPFYEQKKSGDIDLLWKASPMHAANNVNGIGTCQREQVYTLQNGNLLAVQDAVTRKLVETLNPFDNVLFEICNEPYFGGVTLEWQAHIAGVITQTERQLPNRHLISQNIANSYQKIENPNPQVSIFNFHYANPRTVTENLGLGRALADDETGFRGSDAETYRVEGWQFLMAGGGLYDNLDYGYTTLSPEGRDQANSAPGSTTLDIRAQLAILHGFFDTLDFIHMQPATGTGQVTPPAGVAVHALRRGDQAVAAYFVLKSHVSAKSITPTSVSAKDKTSVNTAPTTGEATLDLAAGDWKAEWISPLTGKTINEEQFKHTGGSRTLRLPSLAPDLALRLTRQN